MSDSTASHTHKGIAAFKAGNVHLARQYFEAALDQDPRDAQAWLWMSAVVSTAAEKRECLRRVLDLDPGNVHARRGLDALGPEPARLFVAPSPPDETQLAPARAAPPPAAARRRSTMLLLVLAAATAGVLVVAGALALQSPPASIATPTGQPASTSIRPPTWTPEPTATSRPSPTPRPAPTQLQPLVEEAIRLRQLEPLESIHYVLSSQFDLDLYLRNDLDNQSVVMANTFWEEMRALGLVSRGAEFDRQQLIDSTSRQLSGFYSPSDKTLYAVTQSSRVEPGEYPIIVHEYTHALTDMHFDLSRLYRTSGTTTDADLAARALAEGDASLVENESPWTNFGPTGWENYARSARRAAPLFRQAGVSPAMLFIQSFPYVEGWQFVWTLRDSGGWDAVNAAYADVPVSSEQVLHPEKYQAGVDQPRPVALPDIPAPEQAGYGLVVEGDTLGEFVLRLLLDDFIDDAPRAARAAAGWGGDVLRVWRDDVGRAAFVSLSAWDTGDDAREFASAATQMLNARTRTAAPAEADLERASLEGEGGTAFIGHNGDRVLIIWSPDAGLRDEIVNAFADF